MEDSVCASGPVQRMCCLCDVVVCTVSASVKHCTMSVLILAFSPKNIVMNKHPSRGCLHLVVGKVEWSNAGNVSCSRTQQVNKAEY